MNLYRNRILSLFLICILFWGFIRNGAYLQLESLSSYLMKSKDSDTTITIDSIESSFVESSPIKQDLVNLNGSLANMLDMQGFYGSKGMYITENKCIVSSYASTTTDYEYKETIAFKEFLDENGINLIYVNEPTKYIDDSWFTNQFGIETYTNRNLDLFLSRIKDAGVNTIDLRDNIIAETKNVEDMFYRTDHHWTTPSGLWAAQIIANGLNEYCGYNIDLSLFDIDNFTATQWDSCWLGEQGRKIAETYVGLDDYTELKPNYPTSYTFINSDGSTTDGTFDNFVNEAIYDTEADVYTNPSWHYSYNRINCINNNVESGKVLIIGDSFDHVTQPFLSLGIHQVDSLILRNYDDSFSLRNYIQNNNYDTVIIAYTQCMVGAHDDASSANYRMFSFDY